MGLGDGGRAEARRRFGNGAGQRSHVIALHAPPGQPADRAWTLEHLLEHPLLKTIAYADQRFHGNRSARHALRELDHALREIEGEQHRGGDDDAA